jgi:hypothetical protein
LNPTPIIHALNLQARLNKEAAVREAEASRRQAEWNALHYELLQRLVTEVARASLEAQSLAQRVESLSAKVDFNEKRVRGIEGTVHFAKPAPRHEDPFAVQSQPSSDTAASGVASPEAGGSPDGARRKRRRRRGRRSGGPVAGDAAAATATFAAAADNDEGDATDVDDDLEPGGAEIEAGAAADAGPSTPDVPQDVPPAVPPEVQPDLPPRMAEPYEPPTQPGPPRDEPSPPAPVDHADPGPPDR